MVSDNLMLIFKSFRGDCAGFQTCQIPPAALALRVCPKAAKQRPQGNRSDFAPGGNLPLPF